MPYETREQREDYVHRLCDKASRTLAAESPPGIGYDNRTWDAIQPKDTAAMREIVRFLEGQSTKDELDEKIVAVLSAWRRIFAQWRVAHPSPGTTPER